jgi:transcription initiation factor IIE alpha subunit
MRHYTVTLMHGFSTFKCPLCKHSVTTQEFDSENGNLRSQAARAMNEHAAATHAPRPLPALGSKNWRTR